jgi:hypothetical protein
MESLIAMSMAIYSIYSIFFFSIDFTTIHCVKNDRGGRSIKVQTPFWERLIS